MRLIIALMILAGLFIAVDHADADRFHEHQQRVERLIAGV